MIEEADNLGLKAVQVGSVSVELWIMYMKYCKPTVIFICGQGIFVRFARALLIFSPQLLNITIFCHEPVFL